MKFLRLFAAVAVLGLTPLAARAEETENPYKKAEKGQWVSYNMTVSAMGLNLAGSVKQTVTAKDDKSVTLEVAATINGMEAPKQTQTIDLTKPFDPLAAANVQGAGKAKVEKKGSGKETLEIGGKKYECEWISFSVTTEANGMKIEADTKVWMSKTAPLAVMVKTEMKSKLFNMSMTLEKSGKD